MSLADRVTADPLQPGRDALAACEWEAAFAALDGAVVDDARAEADRLDLLADACWWLGRMDACVDARQRAYELFVEAGEPRRAGQAAVWLYEHHCFLGRPSMGNGWLRRARRALEPEPAGVEWGNLLLREAEVLHGLGELARALDQAQAALELARTLGSTNLEGEALQTAGRILIDDGRPHDGIAHLDEAMLLAVEGRLSPYATGKVYCSLIGACEDLGDLPRAAEWTDATVRWSDRHPFAVFPGLCRVKRAEVLQWRGEWAAAEREARRACDELALIKVGSAGAAWAEVGEIRRRIGDLDGAEDAFGRAQQMGFTPVAGLAALRLAQGRVDAAAALVDGALAENTWNRLGRARLLPVKVQVGVATGDLAGARAAADELAATAADYGTAMLEAIAAVARGRILVHDGDAGGAAAAFRRAAERWRDLDVPYEEATTQLLLAQASREAGDRDAANAAGKAATTIFERLGAAVDARSARAIVQRRSYPCGLTAREVQVLRLVAAGETNKDVAAALGLSPKTVARHLSNIFVKTGVSTRSAAAAFAFASGLMGAGP